MDSLNVNFETMTFWRILYVLLILVSINLIDINTCKVLILCEVCYFCVLRLLHGTIATKQMYGRKFLNRILWHSHAKLCTKKYKNLSVFVKVTVKKSVAPLLCGHRVHS